eukprot:scaffold269218_cov30-Tisochrysis_lutea.AAC.2
MNIPYHYHCYQLRLHPKGGPQIHRPSPSLVPPSASPRSVGALVFFEREAGKRAARATHALALAMLARRSHLSRRARRTARAPARAAMSTPYVGYAVSETDDRPAAD